MVCLTAMQVPSQYLKIINGLIAQARALVEQGETLVSIAFVGNLTTGQMVPLILEEGSTPAKDASAAAIRQMAGSVNADFVFQIREAWTLAQEHTARYQEIMAQYGSIGASPYAQDVASFTLETSHGVWMAMPPLTANPPVPKSRTFGAITFMHAPQVEGRFVGLLPAKEPGAGVLH